MTLDVAGCPADQIRFILSLDGPGDIYPAGPTACTNGGHFYVDPDPAAPLSSLYESPRPTPLDGIPRGPVPFPGGDGGGQVQINVRLMSTGTLQMWVYGSSDLMGTPLTTAEWQQMIDTGLYESIGLNQLSE